MGDPITVNTEDRPVSDNVDKWAAELAHDADKRALAEQMIERTRSGRPRSLAMARRSALGSGRDRRRRPPPKPARNSYTFQRRVMLALKKDIHNRPHGKLVKRVKYYCDVLLRE